jgi:hypothetical protein
MNVSRTGLTGALLLTALAATGCAPAVERLDGQAAPAGITTPTTSTPAATPAVTTPAGTPPAGTTPAGTTTSGTTTSGAPSRSPSASTVLPPRFRLVLGPDGLGGLRLRMTREQAEATGMIEGYEVEDFIGNCGVSRLRGFGNTVYFTPGLGLSSIHAPDGVRTPEGIRAGSTVKELKAAYPTWEAILTGDDDAHDYGWVDTPGNSKNAYRIDVKGGKVRSIALATEGQKCIE